MLDSIAGFFAAVLGGLGVGGGGVLLLYLTAFQNVEPLAAKGLNLGFFIPTAAVSLFGHIKNGFVDYKSALISAAFGIPFVFWAILLPKVLKKSSFRGSLGCF